MIPHQLFDLKLKMGKLQIGDSKSSNLRILKSGNPRGEEG